LITLIAANKNITIYVKNYLQNTLFQYLQTWYIHELQVKVFFSNCQKANPAFLSIENRFPLFGKTIGMQRCKIVATNPSNSWETVWNFIFQILGLMFLREKTKGQFNSNVIAWHICRSVGKVVSLWFHFWLEIKSDRTRVPKQFLLHTKKNVSLIWSSDLPWRLEYISTSVVCAKTAAWMGTNLQDSVARSFSKKSLLLFDKTSYVFLANFTV
jgi:hypothetical protein